VSLRPRWSASIAAVALTALTLGGCASSPEPSSGASGSDGQVVEHVTVATPSASPLAWLYYYIPGPLGFYEEEGLDVEIVGSVPNGNPAQAIATGTVDFAGAQLSLGLPVIESGAADLVWLGFSDDWPFNISVMPDSPVQKISDLAGKRIGIRDDGDVEPATAMLTGNGVAANDFELVRLGQGAAVAAALVQGQVDAMYASPLNEGFVEAQTGTAVRRLPSGEFERFVSSGFMTPRDEVDTGIRVARAVAKAWVWAQENLESAVDLLASIQPEAVPDKAQALATMQVGIVPALPALAAEWAVDPDVLDAQIQVVSPGSSLRAADIVDDDARAKVWAFDVAALRLAARDGDIEAAHGLNDES